MKIKLIDLRCIVCLAQLFEANRAERRHAEHCAVFRSRSCDGAFTLMVEQTLQGGGRAIDRQSKLLAHDGDGEINVLCATQDAGYEVTGLEGFRITPVSHLVIGGAVDVIEYLSGQPLLGETPEIMKVVTIVQMPARAHRVRGFTKSRVAETSQLTTEPVGDSTAKAWTPAMSESGTQRPWQHSSNMSAGR